MTRSPWAKVPTDWIHHQRLYELAWGVQGSEATAALGIYIALTIKANRDGLDNEEARAPKSADQIVTSASYEVLQDYTLFSRERIAAGLRVLRAYHLVDSLGGKRDRRYCIGGFVDKNRWAQLPQSPWYHGSGGLEPLRQFTLRSKTELNALKLYLLFVAFRNTKTQLANLSYTSISDYSGIDRNNIRSGVSLLINLQLIQVLHSESLGAPNMAYHSYKLAGFAMGPTRPAMVDVDLV